MELEVKREIGTTKPDFKANPDSLSVLLRPLMPEHLLRIFKLALKSLWMHKLRSFLTVLGIVFGVCSVIAMLAIGEGASYEAQQQIKDLGSQNIILESVKPPEEQKISGSADTASKAAIYRMFIPLSTARARFGETVVKRRTGSIEAEKVELHEVTVKVDDPKRVVSVAQAINALLKRNHKKEDYKIIVPIELLRRAEETKRIFNIVLGSIAAISLLVGGIGIMNIMLATVTERTREIGIRRALGAKRRDIITQFLVESILLSGTGGLIGVLLGVIIPFFVTTFANMKTIVTFWSPLLAFSISAIVGVVFGLYPAIRAAQMDPVEALRHE